MKKIVSISKWIVFLTFLFLLFKFSSNISFAQSCGTFNVCWSGYRCLYQTDINDLRCSSQNQQCRSGDCYLSGAGTCDYSVALTASFCCDPTTNPPCSTCTVGDGFRYGTCTPPPPLLSSVCGNGVVETGETCDDGNTVSGDGCSSTCQIETPVGYGACGSCNSCGHPQNECRTYNGSCIWDPASCSSGYVAACNWNTNQTGYPTCFLGDGNYCDPVCVSAGGCYNTCADGLVRNSAGTCVCPSTCGTVVISPSGSPTQIITGSTGIFTVTNGGGSGRITNVRFSLRNSTPAGVASLSPSSDNTRPYTTVVSGLLPGTVTLRAIVDKDPPTTTACQADRSIQVIPNQAAPSCSLTISPQTGDLYPGASGQITGTYTQTNGTVERIDLTSSNPSVFTVSSPASLLSPSYLANYQALSPGSATITATGIMNGAPTCTATRVANVSPSPPGWWQASAGDVVSQTGNIRSSIPAQCASSPSCQPYFITDGSSGYPGISIYAGISDYGAGTVSTRGWKAQTRIDLEMYSYEYLTSLIPSTVSITNLSAGNSIATSGSPDSNGYYWLRSNGDFTTQGATNLNRKVILLVNGNLTINGDITLASGNTFFMALVSGNINVSPSVTNLDGVYFSQGSFVTNTRGSSNDTTLNVRGSVASNTISLNRNLGGGNSTSPAEIFTYDPDILAKYPATLNPKEVVWKEVAP